MSNIKSLFRFQPSDEDFCEDDSYILIQDTRWHVQVSAMTNEFIPVQMRAHDFESHDPHATLEDAMEYVLKQVKET